MSSENTNFSQGGADDVDVRKANPLASWFPVIVILLALGIAYAIFYTVFADGSNFQNGSNENDPLPGNYFGIIYKGGFIIPIGFSLLIMTVTFSIERFITLARAQGSGAIDVFVKKIRMALHDGDIDGAMDICDDQKGSVANIMKSGLKKYKEVQGDTTLDKDQRKILIQQELEETTNLELPMLERNLSILATIVSAGVLVGLFGTVLGMIKAFAALSTAGAPDASELATGISEALVNTMIGIGNSLVALVLYNYFTSQIDGLTYRIDEAGYTLLQTFDLRAK